LPHRFGTHRFPEHQTRWAGFDDKILSLYAHGMTVREVPGAVQS
jgi:putative transposase